MTGRRDNHRANLGDVTSTAAYTNPPLSLSPFLRNTTKRYISHIRFLSLLMNQEQALMRSLSGRSFRVFLSLPSPPKKDFLRSSQSTAHPHVRLGLSSAQWASIILLSCYHNHGSSQGSSKATMVLASLVINTAL